MPFLTLIDTGKDVWVPQDSLKSAIDTGAYVVDPEMRVHVVSSRGGRESVSYGDLAAAEKFHETQIESQEALGQESRQRFMEEKYGTLGQKALTAAEATLRGLTFSASDILLGDKETRERKEAHPGIATGFEIGAAVLPAILTGGGTAGLTAAKLGITSAKAIKAGATAKKILGITGVAGAEKIATKIVGKEVGKTLLGKTAIGVSKGAIEAAVFGTGQAISELALSDEPLSGERIASVVGSNLLMGALFGGVIGGALPILGAAATGVKKIAGKAIDDSPEVLKTVWKKIAGESPTKIKKNLVAQKDKIESVFVNSQASYNNIRASLKIQRGSLAAESKSAKKIDDALDSFDIAQKKYREELTTNLTPDMKEFQPSRVVNSLISASDDSFNKGLKIIEDYQVAGNNLVNTANRVGDFAEGALIAPELAADIRKTVAVLKGIEKTAEGASKWGTEDYLMLAVGAGVGEDHIPYLSSIPYMKELLLARSGYKLVNNIRIQAMYSKLKTASPAVTRTIGLTKLATESANKTEKGVKGFLKSAAKGAKEVGKKAVIPSTIIILNSASFSPSEKKEYATKNVQEAFQRRSEELLRMNYSPDLIKQKVADSLGPIPPGILAAIQQVQIRKIKFLTKKLPQDPSGDRIIPKPFKPSSYQLKTFSRYMRAAEKPLTVLEDMKAGKLTQEGVEALRTIYPEMYNNIQMHILEGIPELRVELNYKSRLQLSRLFQVAVDESMEPEFIAVMQDDFQATGQKESKTGKSFSIPEMEAPTSDSLTSSKPGNF